MYVPFLLYTHLLPERGDFGLATVLQTDTDTVPNSRCGTHGFLAPECLEEKVFCKESDLLLVEGNALHHDFLKDGSGNFFIICPLSLCFWVKWDL